jgi:hypothetical protein
LYKSSGKRKWKIKSKNTSLKKTKKGLWVKVYQVGKQTRPESGWNFTRLKKNTQAKKQNRLPGYTLKHKWIWILQND